MLDDQEGIRLQQLARQIGVENLSQGERARLQSTEDAEAREASTRERRLAEQRQMETQAQMAALAERVTSVETWREMFRQAVATMVGEVADQVEKNAERTLRKEIESLEKRHRDEIARVDAKTYSTLKDERGARAEKAMQNLRKDIDHRSEIVKAQIATLEERIGALDKQHKDWRHEFLRQLAKTHVLAADLDASVRALGPRLDKRLDEIGAELADIRQVLTDAELIAAPEPAIRAIEFRP
jgi:hypothetical protein